MSHEDSRHTTRSRLLASLLALDGVALEGKGPERILVDLVFAKLRRLVSPAERADVDDLVQDAMRAILGSLESFERDSKFQTWVHSICIHVLRHHRRGRGRAGRIIAPSDGELPDVAALDDDELEAWPRLEEARRRLKEAVDGLPASLREPFTLHLDGLSHDEIAERLALEPDGVVHRIVEAWKVLKERFDRAHDDYFTRRAIAAQRQGGPKARKRWHKSWETRFTKWWRSWRNQ